jgi:hypothetical protein
MVDLAGFCAPEREGSGIVLRFRLSNSAAGKGVQAASHIK